MIFFKRLFCLHQTKTTVVLSATVGVETTAHKCSRCGKLTNKSIDV